MSGKKNISKKESRRIRIQQIIFTTIALLIILVMVIGLFVKY